MLMPFLPPDMSTVTQTAAATTVRGADKSAPALSIRLPRRHAVREARQFVYDNSFANMNTINQQGQFLGFATSQIEYYIDSADDDASLLLIRVDMSTAFRNVDKGSPASLTIRTGDSPNAETPVELASQKRIVLYGEFEATEPPQDEIDRFLAVHPDAAEWQPGKSGFHKTEWVRFVISGIYYIGGFGDKHYIGQIPVDMYREEKPDPKPEPQARGWLRWPFSG